MINAKVWNELKDQFESQSVTLVAVSKTKPMADIQALYELGQRDFGENYVQELAEKQAALPTDIRWHFIGHLQSNKVKYIAPFVQLIHGVDSPKLLREISKQAAKAGRVIDVLLQAHIASEETKFGMDEKEIMELVSYCETRQTELQQVRICGLMGMASFTEDQTVVRGEFRRLKALFDQLRAASFLSNDYFRILSMGMSGDYPVALEEGSTMVRIGSMLFGSR